MKFREFNLHENVLKGIENAGFDTAMPVQEKTILEALGGKDIGVQSHTGSGKTAAFLIPILQYYCEIDRDKRKKTLIIAPTRELVVQIEQELELLGVGVDIIAGSFYGGIGYGKQEALIKNDVDVIIGTPGRLIDFGKSGKINFHDFGHVVIDEADRMFDMGFYPDITKMMRMMLPPKQRRTMLFSATLSTKVMNLAWEFMNEPVTIEIESENITVNEISQVLYHVSTAEKMSLLLGILKKENPASALIFTNTKYAAVELTERLKANGFDAHYIMGDLPQRKRLAVIDKVKSGEVKFLVATDVAARGLHVDDLEMVVNYDIPEDFENYVHRIGRTARAGKSGKAVTFACEKFVYGLEAIEKYIDMKIPVEWPEKELFLEDKSAGKNFYREKQAAVKSNSRQPYDNRSGRPGRTSGGQRSDRPVRGRPEPRNAGRGPRQGNNSQRDARSEGSKIPSARPGSSGGRKTNASRIRPDAKPRSTSPESGKAAVTRTSVPHTENKNTKKNVSSGKRMPERLNSKGLKRDLSSNNTKAPLKLTRTSTEAEKIAYYRNKYGEDFEIKSTPGSGKPANNIKKEGIFKKLFKAKKKKDFNN